MKVNSIFLLIDFYELLYTNQLYNSFAINNNSFAISKWI